MDFCANTIPYVGDIAPTSIDKCYNQKRSLAMLDKSFCSEEASTACHGFKPTTQHAQGNAAITANINPNSASIIF